MRDNNSKDLIYLCKNKLIDIDAVLPILMEIKSLYPKTNVSFVFYDDSNLDLIKKNYNLWECVQSMHPSVYVLRSRNKFARMIRLIKFVAYFSFKDIIIIKNTDALPLHSITMGILKKVSTVKEIKTFLRSRSLSGYRNFYIQQALSRERRGVPLKSKYFDGNYDYFLSVISAFQFKEFFKVDAPKDKIINIGYVRKLSQWQKYMEDAVKRNKEINGGAYFLYILTYLGSRAAHRFKEPAAVELLEESLSVLKKYNTKIKTVFRPHATTDVKEVEALLKRLNYSNYMIDCGHPMILSAKAKFVIANIFSGTMYDAYYLGRPVIEYTQYDPEVFEKLGRQSACGNCCDFFIHRDGKRLEETVDRLVNGSAEVVRDPKFMQENFPDTPPEFYEFLRKIFS